MTQLSKSEVLKPVADTPSRSNQEVIALRYGLAFIHNDDHQMSPESESIVLHKSAYAQWSRFVNKSM